VLGILHGVNEHHQSSCMMPRLYTPFSRPL
jgi:hypothetical protein